MTPNREIQSLVAVSPSITAGLVERMQHAAAQCHKALTDGSVTEESARAWLRTIVRTLFGIDEWGDDFDRWLNEWAESYRAAQLPAYDSLGRCLECEWTPSGFLAHPCEAHECRVCRHLAHDAEDGCGHPDPFTGWCECEGDAPAAAPTGGAS